MGKRRRYDDKFRASAVIMLEAEGYPKQEGVLSRISKKLDVPRTTLRRWFYEQSNPPPPEIVQEKRRDLADMFEAVAWQYLERAAEPDVVNQVSGQAAITSAAIATDKMRLLRGLPTEIIEILPSVIDALRKLEQDPVEVFRRLIERAALVHND